MVNLQIARFIGRQADLTLAARAFNKKLLELLGKDLAPGERGSANLGRVSKAVRTDALALAATDAERFEGNTLLPDVPGGPWRVVVTVLGLQLFGRDVTVLQDVLNHCPRALCGNSFCLLDEPLGQLVRHDG